MTGRRWPTDLAAVVFDIDGTLLDSADGIVAGFRHALESVGATSPDDASLRSDLGPPVGDYFTALGLAENQVREAVLAYRAFYTADGLYRASPYEGVVELLDHLVSWIPLGTATAKRTDTAQAILTAHDLAHYFTVVNGTEETRTTKPETLADTLQRLGSPDPGRVVMVGDRHSDITAGLVCGVFSVGVTWGYGPVDELRDAGADALVDSPAELLKALRDR
jgi:phosphoglycolate phosphatase